MDERELINSCRRGDPKAQYILYTTYAPTMLSLCRRYVGNIETAQDILQEGFIKVFAKIGTYKGEGAFGGWVRRVFITASLEYLRQNGAAKFHIPIEECDYLEDEMNPSVLSKLSTDDIYTCIAQLPLGYRTIFNLYVIEGYSHSEIASMLNIMENSSQSQLVRARKILQKKILSKIG